MLLQRASLSHLQVVVLLPIQNAPIFEEEVSLLLLIDEAHQILRALRLEHQLAESGELGHALVASLEAQVEQMVRTLLQLVLDKVIKVLL